MSETTPPLTPERQRRLAALALIVMVSMTPRERAFVRRVVREQREAFVDAIAPYLTTLTITPGELARLTLSIAMRLDARQPRGAT